MKGFLPSDPNIAAIITSMWVFNFPVHSFGGFGVEVGEAGGDNQLGRV